MFRQRSTAALGVIAISLLIGRSAARANEADDVLHHLIAQAREQAAAGDPKSLADTLGEIVKALPNANADGVSAVNELNVHLAQPAERSGDVPPLSASQGDAVSPPVGDSHAEPDVAASSPTPSPPEPTSEHPAAPAPVVGAESGSHPDASSQAVLPAPPATPAEPVQNAPAPTVLASRPDHPPAIAGPPEATRPAGKPLTDLLRRQGDSFLADGDVSGARRFYRRGAELGCGTCAEALAATYDAQQLRRLGVVGVKPDPAQADAWRAKARQLGQASAP